MWLMIVMLLLSSFVSMRMAGFPADASLEYPLRVVWHIDFRFSNRLTAVGSRRRHNSVRPSRSPISDRLKPLLLSLEEEEEQNESQTTRKSVTVEPADDRRP